MAKNQPFWTDNKFEPKQSFKFRLLFEFREGVGGENILDIPYHYVISVDKPRFQVKEKVSKLLNEERKFPTNVTWFPVTITMIDTVDNRLMSYLSKFINSRNDNSQKSYFRIDEYNNTSFKNTATAADVLLENIRIQQLKNEDTFALDGGSQGVEEWILHSAWISNYEPSQVNYGNESLSTYTFTILYNWATVEYLGNIPQSLRAAENAQSATTVPLANGTRIGRDINAPLDFSDVAIDPYRSEPGSGWDPTVIGINEYKSTIQKGRAGTRVYGLSDSITIREQPYPTTPGGRRNASR